MPDQNERDFLDRRRSSMIKERSSFIDHYKELSDFIKPRRGRFFLQDRNRGEKRYNNIINSRATQAHRIARAGMLAGTMSPTRPWFSFETADPDLMEFAPVKLWLHDQEQLIRAVLNQSNFYNMVSNMLGELILFGTGCMTHVDDFEDIARFYTHTVGSYAIAQNHRYEVDTITREQEYTVEQLVGWFGLDNQSDFVKNAYDRGNYDLWVPAVQFIGPNENFKSNGVLSEDKAFISVYYEPGNKDKNKFLSKKGFDEFPAYVPRWDLTGEDIYGTDCPGMVALGDVKQLQIEEKRKAQGIDKAFNPPLHGPPSLNNVPVNSLPGGLTIYDSGPVSNKLEPVYSVNPHLQDMRLDIDAVERRINEAFYVDMFLAISNMEGIQPRNQLDLSQRNEERLLQLGPVLERIHSEFSSKLIERLFAQGVRAGVIRNAPQELQGQELEVRFISSLAMAQRAVATQPIERLAGFVGSLAEGFPSVLDKFDADQAVDEYAKAIGGPPSIVVPDEIVAAKRQAQQQAAQQQAALEQANMAAQSANQLASAKTNDANALTDIAKLASEG